MAASDRSSRQERTKGTPFPPTVATTGRKKPFSAASALRSANSALEKNAVPQQRTALPVRHPPANGGSAARPRFNPELASRRRRHRDGGKRERPLLLRHSPARPGHLSRHVLMAMAWTSRAVTM